MVRILARPCCYQPRTSFFSALPTMVREEGMAADWQKTEWFLSESDYGYQGEPGQTWADRCYSN